MLEPFRPSVMAARGFLVPTVRVRVLGAELPANAGAAKQKSGDNVERTVIILAAGQGKRMHSALPKVLHEMGDKTLLGHAVAAAQGINPDRLCVVVRHERDQVVAHINQIAPEAVVADQDEIPGTGRAVACALEKLAETKPVTGTCVVTSGDGYPAFHKSRRPHRIRTHPARCRRQCEGNRRTPRCQLRAAGNKRDKCGNIRF